jgi:hypothetical protein
MRKVHFDFDILFQGDIRGGWCGVVGRSGWFSGGRGDELAAGPGRRHRHGRVTSCVSITSTRMDEPSAACSDRVGASLLP